MSSLPSVIVVISMSLAPLCIVSDLGAVRDFHVIGDLGNVGDFGVLDITGHLDPLLAVKTASIIDSLPLAKRYGLRASITSSSAI